MPAPASYIVINKPHRRVEWNGSLKRFEVGDIIDGLTLSDLKAFPDRFRVATAEQVDAFHARQEAAMVAVDHAPLMVDAQQAAAQEAVLEQEMVALQARLSAAKQRTMLTTQAQAEAMQPPPVPPGETKALADMTPAERAVANTAAAERMDAERQASAHAAAEKAAVERQASGNKR